MKDEKPNLADAVKLLGQAVEATDEASLDLPRLIAYQRGELTADERREVEERLTWSRPDARLLLHWQKFSQGDGLPLDEGDLDAAWQRLEGRLAVPTPAPEEPPARSSRRAASPFPIPREGESRRHRVRLPWAAAAALLVSSTVGWGIWQSARVSSLERQLAEGGAETGWGEGLHLESDPLRAAGTATPRPLTFPHGVGRRVVYFHLPHDLPGGKGTLHFHQVGGAFERTLTDVPVVDGTLSWALARGQLPPGRYAIEAIGGGAPTAHFELEVAPSVD